MESTALQSIEQAFISHFFDQSYALIEKELPDILVEHPDWLNGWKILSDTLFIQGKDAKEPAYQALQLNKQDPQEHCYYGLVLKKNGDLSGAAHAFHTAMRLAPNNVAALNNLGIVEKDMGNVEAGVAYFKQALAIMPDYAECHSNLLFCLTHSEDNPKKLFKAHQQYSHQFEQPYIKQWPVHHKPANQNRQLKVGFVSADFRDHSIAYCLEPLLQSLSKDNSLSLYAYYNHPINDTVTQRLQPLFTQWHAIANLTDDDLLKQIRSNDIDVLIDMSGHTADNRLPVFAKKPAPIQISWFGYLATTGLKAMDYYLCDQYLAPPTLLDNYFTEKLVQLPVNALFQPDAHSPEVSTLPALKNGYITFGSFHRASKVSDHTIKRWAALLNALPTSHLVLGGLDGDACATSFIETFESLGISAKRIHCFNRTDIKAYLRLHDHVDICLDTYPSSGITPALHAAWMGVPTLCESTNTLTGRGAMAIMSHLDLQTFIGQDWQSVIQQAALFDADITSLQVLRAKLRDKFKASALMDKQKQSEALSKALNQMWQRWQKRKTNRSFIA